MTEIKKGTPVWVWDSKNENKLKATYLFYDDLSNSECRHVCMFNGSRLGFVYAEPISKTNDLALQLIAEAESKIAEAKKLLNAQ